MERKYRPSNGTEGISFEEDHCMQCINCDPDPNGKKQCDIWCAAICFNINEPEYPKEWIYGEDGKPTCTAWVKWDWGRDGDPDDDGNPKAPPPPVPDNQLMLFSVADDILQNHKPSEQLYEQRTK